LLIFLGTKSAYFLGNSAHIQAEGDMSLIMQLTKSVFATAIAGLLLISASASAEHIGFENTAVISEFEFVNPDFVFEEDGFVFTPQEFSKTHIVSGISLGIGGQMVDNGFSDYLLFEDPSPLTMTHTDGAFNLLSLQVGPTGGGLINFPTSVTGSLVGYFAGGGSSILNYSSLTTTTLLSPGWMNLSSVVFTTAEYSAIDNVIADIPAPGTLALFGLALLGLRQARRKPA
jgi:hypothetical protein